MNSGSKKSTKIAAKKISQKYKNLKKPKKTFLLNEEDLETIAYDEPKEEDLFRGKKAYSKPQIKRQTLKNLKKQQEDAVKYYKRFNEKKLNKKKRKAKEKEEQLIEIIKVPKKRKQQKGKAAQIAAKKISKKYKNIRFR